MSLLSDLVKSGGLEIPLKSGGSYKVEYKDGADFLILTCQAGVFTAIDLNLLQQLSQALAGAKGVETQLARLFPKL